MTHFERFDLPMSFYPDPASLKLKYAALTAEDGQNKTPLPLSGGVAARADIEQAYRILQDEDETMRYILELKGLLNDDYEPDPQFALDVGDITEELMEVELDERQELLMNVEQKATRLLSKIYEDVAPVLENYQEHVTSEEELLQVKEFYHKKKYLQGILDRITGIRNIASPS